MEKKKIFLWILSEFLRIKSFFKNFIYAIKIRINSLEKSLFLLSEVANIGDLPVDIKFFKLFF
jgi:hypothetical protein